MGILINLIGRLTPAAPQPWVDASIFEFIMARIDPDSGRYEADGEPLPDEAPDASTISWADGALDGVLGHHGASEESVATAQQLAGLFDRVARTGDQRAAAAAYAILKEARVLGLVDPLLACLGKYRTPFEPHLSRFALQLATLSGDRGPVKVGIALLGAMRLYQHEEIVTALGKHEEFTLYTADALVSMFEDPSERLWALAQSVEGWGRIQVVERLVPTANPHIRQWLRREGFRNSVMYEYLALTAAVHGGLSEVLEQEQVLGADLVAAGEIISAMITADIGRVSGMNVYPDAAETCRAYLTHALLAAPDLVHLHAAQLIFSHVERDQRSAAERAACGWTPAARSDVVALARRYATRNDWGTLIREQLAASDERAFERAARAAFEAGIDAYDWYRRRLTARPHDSGAWLYATESANAERITELARLAERSLPLAQMSRGPADREGARRDAELHTCLEVVLQRLKDFPGEGMSLICAGLRSPVLRNRSLAINALAAAAPTSLSLQARDVILLALSEETNNEIRTRLKVLSQRF
jgi:hypothetical protein